MKETRKSNLKKVDINTKLSENKITNLTVFLQIIFVVLIGICSIISIFINEFLSVVEVLLALTLLVIAYNNMKIYNRKALSWIYIINGLFLLVMSIYLWIGEYFGV